MTQQELLKTIEKAAEDGRTELTLHDNQLTSVPAEIGQLTNLTWLDLGSNQLTSVPAEIGQLTNLTTLWLNRNQLTSVPAEIGQLTNLTWLDLGSNQLTSVPAEIGQLTNLTTINLEGNQLTFPPPSITRKGSKAVLAFLRNVMADGRNRYEAKLLLLGQGGVGKSTLLQQLRGLAFEKLDTTYGVDVARIELPNPEKPGITLHLNAWDFVGQEIEHATHQFFMSPKSVYLLLWNARHGHLQGRLDYWLERIQSLAPNEPVLLIATHIDERAPDINYESLKQTYPQLAGHYDVDNTTGDGVHELRQAIAALAARLDHMGQAWPRTWLEVESGIKGLANPPARGISGKLRKMFGKVPEGRHHISYGEFAEVCRSWGITGEQDLALLSEVLHNLGILMHFDDDPALQDLVVLKPNWITKAISFALTDEATKAASGILKHGELPRIWKDYSVDLYPAFFSLMNRFELSYQIPEAEDESLIPALLPFKPPGGMPEIHPRVKMVCKLSSVPAGLMSRFIVRTHRFSGNWHWREGVVLHYDGQKARAEVSETRREFHLAVDGSSPIHFFAILKDTLDQILDWYPGLEVERLVPCPCREDEADAEPCGHLFDFAELVRREKAEKYTIECGVTFENVSVNRLLYGIHESARPQVLEQVAQVERDPAEPYRQVIRLGQRSIIQEYNRLESIDTRCPNLFTVSLGEEDNACLHLVCQSSDGWHFAGPGARYPLPDVAGAASTITPLLVESLPCLEHLVPLAGIGVELNSRVSEERAARLMADIETMRELTATDAPDHGRVEGLRQSLAELYRLLGELDAHRSYGGLKMADTPDGYRLWLCPYHYAQLQTPVLHVGEFQFDAFLCHNSQDKSAVQEIAALLKARGIKTWLDKEQIVGGDQWQKKMAEGLRESKSTLVFISDNGFGAWHSEESQYALSIVAGGQTKRRIIPVLLPPLTGIPDEDDTAFLKTRHAITFSSPDDEGAVEDLVNGIRAQRHLYRFHLSILRLFRSEARRDLDEFLSYRGGRQPGCPVPPNDILAACPYDS